MKKYIIIFFLVLFAVANSFSQILEPVKWEFSENRLSNDKAELILKAKIKEKWHLYSQFIEQGGPVPTSFYFDKSDKYELKGDVTESPKPIQGFDKSFKLELKYFINKANFKQKIKILSDKPFSVKGHLKFMCCNNINCLPPEEINFEFKLNESKQEVTKNNSTVTTKVIIEDTAKKNDLKFTKPIYTSLKKDTSKNEISELQTKSGIEDANSSEQEKKSLWIFFFFSLALGFAAVFTPCVFPMIPLTVSFFVNNTKNKSKVKINAIIYGASRILIYTSIGAVLTFIIGDTFLVWLKTNWIPNIIFFLLFVFFAASFFGMFEIILPSKFVNKTDRQADRGGYIGIFFMALTLVLVSFSCTVPLIGSLLVEAATGDILKPLIGMFGFSLAFSMPFTFLAFTPSLLKKLPKSGGWLNSVKIVLGFIILALAMKFLSVPDQMYHWGLLSRNIYIAIWVVIFFLMGLYLLGKIKFKNDSDVNHIGFIRLILVIITFSFVVYLIPGMFGNPLKEISAFLPPQKVNLDKNISLNEHKTNICEKPVYSDIFESHYGINEYFDYKQGLRCAKKLNKPVFIDFKGHSCSNCKKMENKVLFDNEILNRLNKNFVIISLYCDDNTKLPKSEWFKSSFNGKIINTIGKKNLDFEITNFKTNTQPYYVLIDSKGKLLTKPMGYNLNIDDFVDFLDNAIKEE